MQIIPVYSQRKPKSDNHVLLGQNFEGALRDTWSKMGKTPQNCEKLRTDLRSTVEMFLEANC